jgi:hypothetical protein
MKQGSKASTGGMKDNQWDEPVHGYVGGMGDVMAVPGHHGAHMEGATIKDANIEGANTGDNPSVVPCTTEEDESHDHNGLDYVLVTIVTAKEMSSLRQLVGASNIQLHFFL